MYSGAASSIASPAKAGVHRSAAWVGDHWQNLVIASRFRSNGEMIGVGSGDWVRHPLPPNRTCGSPASGSPVDGFTCKRTGGRGHGLVQAEEPVFGKEGIGPPDVVVAATDPFPARALAQNVAQAPADPAVERRERRAVTVFEIFEPAPQRPVEIGDDQGQAVCRGSLGLCPDRVHSCTTASAAAAACELRHSTTKSSA